MDNFIPRTEHEEFCRRLDQHNDRQDKRISFLEEEQRHIGDLTASVRELAVNMTNMLREQERQGKRLETLEARDGEKWRKTVWYVATAVLGAVLGFVFSRLGL